MRKCMAEKRGKPFCGSDATRHLLVEADYQSFVCDRHLSAAVLKVQAVDHHAYREGPCDIPKAEGGHWHHSTLDREGWCWVEDQDTQIESELQLVGSEPSDSGAN